MSPVLHGLLFVCARGQSDRVSGQSSSSGGADGHVLVGAASSWGYLLPGYCGVFLGGAFSIQKVEAHLYGGGIRAARVRCKHPSMCARSADLAEEALRRSPGLRAVCVCRQRMLDREPPSTKGTPPNSMA